MKRAKIQFSTPIEYAIDKHWGPLLILRRNLEKQETTHCPFCGSKHGHGSANGGRIPHCSSEFSSYENSKRITFNNYSGIYIISSNSQHSGLEPTKNMIHWVNGKSFIFAPDGTRINTNQYYLINEKTEKEMNEILWQVSMARLDKFIAPSDNENYRMNYYNLETIEEIEEHLNKNKPKK